MARPDEGSIDFTYYFLPEHFTPLFYTPLYAQLTAPQRRRYNQLHACYSNEQIMFFEHTMAPHVLPALQRRPLPASLAASLDDFLAEEQHHTQMFWEINQRCFPYFYTTSAFYFLQIPWGISGLLAWAGQRPGLFACLLWVMLLEEERAVTMGREILRCSSTLEPHFVDVHRRHLRDEVGHVQWDEALLDTLWESLSWPLRYANAALSRWLLGKFFMVPKRSNMRVIVQLAQEFPELRPLLAQYQRALRALKDCPAWHGAYTPEQLSLKPLPGSMRTRKCMRSRTCCAVIVRERLRIWSTITSRILRCGKVILVFGPCEDVRQANGATALAQKPVAAR